VDSDSSVANNPAHGEDPDLAHWATAIRIQVEHPGWTVVWLARLSEYRAYARFRLKSGRPYVNAPDSEKLVDLIEQAEEASAPRGRAQSMRASP
jgi:hypothetical protein